MSFDQVPLINATTSICNVMITKRRKVRENVFVFKCQSHCQSKEYRKCACELKRTLQMF